MSQIGHSLSVFGPQGSPAHLTSSAVISLLILLDSRRLCSKYPVRSQLICVSIKLARNSHARTHARYHLVHVYVHKYTYHHIHIIVKWHVQMHSNVVRDAVLHTPALWVPTHSTLSVSSFTTLATVGLDSVSKPCLNAIWIQNKLYSIKSVCRHRHTQGMYYMTADVKAKNVSRQAMDCILVLILYDSSTPMASVIAIQDLATPL